MEEIKSNRKRLKNKPSIFSLFIDLKSAFDKVNHEILISKLGDLGFDKKLIQTIKLIYSNTKASVGEQSPFDIELGVLQGSLISPILFNLFINDLFKESSSLFLNLYAYADDIVFLVEGEQNLRSLITRIESWCELNSMTINHSKSGIFVLNAKRSGPHMFPLKEILGFPIVFEYKYLGVTFSNNLSFNLHLDSIKKINSTYQKNEKDTLQ